MGMYPGATLCYGVELPEDIFWDELPWVGEECDGDYDWAMEKELDRLGFSGVHLVWYGHMGYGETGTVLCTKSMRFYAYDPTELRADELAVDAGDAELLGQAWAALFPGVEVTAPKWLISLTYG